MADPSPTPTPITAKSIRDFVERAGPTGALDGGRDMLLRAADALAAMTAARDAANLVTATRVAEWIATEASQRGLAAGSFLAHEILVKFAGAAQWVD